MNLQKFGFTATEAKVYLTLLPISPATGYAVAQGARLARANTYDALEGLASRGAVTRLPGRPARYAAVDPEALVGRLRRQVSGDLDSLNRQLGQVRRAAAAPLPVVEILPDRNRLLASAAECARGARSELLAVVGPWGREIYADLRAPGGATARLLSLGSPAPAGAVLRDVPARDIEAYWGGLPIALVVDRRRAVCGIVRGDQGGTGVATEHPGVVPFLRHLLRRELAAPPRGVS
jgi:predicted transcriptional regulator